MRRRPSPLLVPMALLVTALAGCAGTDGNGRTDPGDRAAGDGVVVHRGDDVLTGAAPAFRPIVHSLGTDSFEPTLGIDATGAIFYSVTPDRGVAIGFGPGVYRSLDGGATWTDVSPRTPFGPAWPPETNDPYLYVDPTTGRVFQFPMAPIALCSVLSWSDDQGQTWFTNPRGCGNPPPYDHQTIAAGKPREQTTRGYPNILYQCVNQVAGASCATSLDGGLSWLPTVPVYTNDYLLPGDGRGPLECPGSSVHGHVVTAPDGTVYLPSSMCGYEAIVAVSQDDGQTWRVTTVSSLDPGTSDPAVAIDSEGVVYYVFRDDIGVLHLVRSHDAGETWSAPVVVSPPGVTATLPAIAAAGAGEVVLAYPATDDLDEGYESRGADQDKAVWDAYLSIIPDARADEPVVYTVRANPADDPIMRGFCGPVRCATPSGGGIVDFLDVVMGPDGKPYAAFVDACVKRCVEKGKRSADNDASEAILVTLAEAPFRQD